MLITEFMVSQQHFRVETTKHALVRMEQRGIDKFAVAGSILCLGERLLNYNNSGEEIAIINHNHGITVIAQVRKNKIVVITVINRANTFVHAGTVLEQIA